MLEKLKIHKFRILIGVFGVLVFWGAVFGAYKLGQRSIYPEPTEGLTPTPVVVVTPTAEPTANWKTYINTKLGFSLKYPQDWDPLLEESIHSTRSEVSFAPYFSIEVGVFYHQDKQRELTYQEVVKQFARTEEKPWETTLDGRPASRIENLIAAKKSRNIYLISAYSLTRSPMDKQAFNLILSTFKFLPSADSGSSPQAGSGQGE